MQPLALKGCRHDVLGHYLKAIGLLRVLALRADAEHRDPEAEGWWDAEHACFMLRSATYPTIEHLIQFVKDHYRPTPVFSAWNTGGGLDEKWQVVFSPDPTPWRQYYEKNREALRRHGFDPPGKNSAPPLPEEPFPLRLQNCRLPSTDEIDASVVWADGRRTKRKVQITWSRASCERLAEAIKANRKTLERAIKFTKPVKAKLQSARPEFVFDIADRPALHGVEIRGVHIACRVKESGKKAVIANLAKELGSDAKLDKELLLALELGRERFPRFQADNADDGGVLERYRDLSPQPAAEAFDAIFSTRATPRPTANPVFLNKGDAGNAEVFRALWVYFREARRDPRLNALGCLLGESDRAKSPPKGNGSPYFPDAIKSYNVGSGWVAQEYPFYPLDYVLAVEGALSLRGSVARRNSARARPFAAFPFLFDTGEEEVDDENKIIGTAPSLWLPIWTRPTTYAELASFFADSQARLPRKDAMVSAEFVRAIAARGVDAGFAGWQEFRFRMKGSKVPWVTTSRYLAATRTGQANPASQNQTALLNTALAPVDESHFLDQFDPHRTRGKIDRDGPHRLRQPLDEAMRAAALTPSPANAIALLGELFAACKKLSSSKALRDMLPGKRDMLPGKRATFFRPLPARQWEDLLQALEGQPEFRIARALASLQPSEKSEAGAPAAQPMLGSLLPLKLDARSWRLAPKPERHQSVWTGQDPARDLAAVLWRRYLDSMDAERPALRATRYASLADITAFINRELDDSSVARWTEALSLIDWRTPSRTTTPPATDPTPLHPTYAALRVLLELECAGPTPNTQGPKRRSCQPFALLRDATPTSLALATTEALRWISIWGVPNPWGTADRAERPTLAGKSVIALAAKNAPVAATPGLAQRLAAAVCIPLAPGDRDAYLYRSVTLPPQPTARR